MGRGRDLLILAAAFAAYAGGTALVGKPVPKQGEPAAVTAQAPPPARSTAHRKVHRTVPPAARPKWKPIPGVRPIPPIAAPERPAKAKPKRQRVAGLPSCAVVRRQAASMTWAQKLAAYTTATPEMIAHGRRCLGQ